MDLHFNADARFTRWVVRAGLLREPFVVVDVGVQGGENPRWHLLGDHLVVHGFDAIQEVVEGLKRQNARKPNRHYHWTAAGNEDAEKTFYFRADNAFSSSFYRQGESRFADGTPAEQARSVPVRRLDTLLRDGVIPRPDFLKVDVEGFEKNVFLGAGELLTTVLGVETETSFNISPDYPKGHFGTLSELVLAHHLLVFDLNFDRVPRASYQRAIARAGLTDMIQTGAIGRPATLNVLFCRDPIQEADHPEAYTTPPGPLSVDQLIKQMIVYELHGYSDIALDMAERFADRLGARLDVEEATKLLADPYCRMPDGQLGAQRSLGHERQHKAEATALIARIRELEGQMNAMTQSRSWRWTAALRNVRSALGRVSR